MNDDRMPPGLRSTTSSRGPQGERGAMGPPGKDADSSWMLPTQETAERLVTLLKPAKIFIQIVAFVSTLLSAGIVYFAYTRMPTSFHLFVYESLDKLNWQSAVNLAVLFAFALILFFVCIGIAAVFTCFQFESWLASRFGFIDIKGKLPEYHAAAFEAIVNRAFKRANITFFKAVTTESDEEDHSGRFDLIKTVEVKLKEAAVGKEFARMPIVFVAFGVLVLIIVGIGWGIVSLIA